MSAGSIAQLVVFGLVVAVWAAVYIVRIARREQNGWFVPLAASAVCARIGFGVVESVWGPLPGAEVDAVNFHGVAATLAAEWSAGVPEIRHEMSRHVVRSLGAWLGTGLPLAQGNYIWVNLLAAVFVLAGSSDLIVASAVHAVLFLLALGNITRIAAILGTAHRHINLVLLIVALSPVLVLFTAVPLREGPVIVALTFFVRAGLEARPGLEWRAVGVWISGVALIALHVGFIILVPFTLLWGALRQHTVRSIASSLWRPKLAIYAMLFVGSIIGVDSYLRMHDTRKVATFVGDEGRFGYDAVAQAQARKARGDTAYRVNFSRTGFRPLDFALAIPEASLRFVTVPLSTPATLRLSTADVPKILDGLLHVFFVGVLLRGFRHHPRSGEIRGLIALYGVLAVLFGVASGTTGIAIRHRSKFSWLIIVVGMAIVSQRAQLRHSKSRPRWWGERQRRSTVRAVDYAK